jgi:hypothetical protein
MFNQPYGAETYGLEKASRIHIVGENIFHIPVENSFHIATENKIHTPMENKIPIPVRRF